MRVLNTIADADRLAELAHFGMNDQGGRPYIDHPRRVAEGVRFQTKRLFGEEVPYLVIAALLHDVPEDTRFSLAILRELGVDKNALEVIDLVTRKTDVPDEIYYARIKAHPGALIVKDEDITDNMDPRRLRYLSPARQAKLTVKYASARAQLGLS